jgi:glycerol dehydrogenase-like iron-containing ADH family enzyme
MDSANLREAIDAVSAEFDLVVGLGGGIAVDAAKYFAAARDRPVVQVPTIVSTGAIVHGYCGSFDGRRLVGERDQWAWADCDYVLIDHEIVLQAPTHLNTAGLGDVLCERSSIAEWRHHNREAGTLAQDPPEIASLQHFHDSIINEFPHTLNQDQGLTPATIQLIARSLQDRDTHRISLPAAANVDHPFLAALEQATDRRWIHGEIVALGALIVCWHSDESPVWFAAQLDACQIRRRPTELGLSKQELWNGISLLTTQLSEATNAPEYTSCLRRRPFTHTRFEQLWTFLEQEAANAPLPTVTR